MVKALMTYEGDRIVQDLSGRNVIAIGDGDDDIYLSGIINSPERIIFFERCIRALSIILGEEIGEYNLTDFLENMLRDILEVC